MSEFDGSVYVPTIDAILGVSDMTKVSVKKIRRALQELFDVEFEETKKQINDLILERYHYFMEEKDKDDAAERKRIEEKDARLAAKLQEEDKYLKRTVRKSTVPKPPKVQKPRKKRDPSSEPKTSTLSTLELNLSPKLAALLNKTKLSRTQVVKEMWIYIKAHDLQNPEDKREILCDEKMQEIFGKKITMFQLNKVLSNHLYKDDESVSYT